MTQNEIGMTLREESKNFEEKIQDDIIRPAYYDNVGTFEGIEFTQGQLFADSALYKHYDQIFCTLDGTADIVLVPHVYR